MKLEITPTVLEISKMIRDSVAPPTLVPGKQQWLISTTVVANCGACRLPT